MNCAECGALLHRLRPARAGAVIICPQCQAQAPEGAKFCFNCGRRWANRPA